jgi:hypothetical protein
MSTVNDTDVLVRRMDVTARVTDQVVELSDRPEGGVLLETLIGRYVLDKDARQVWLLINGRNAIADVIDGVARHTGSPAADIRQAVLHVCDRLLALGLVEFATSTERADLAGSAVAG